jgi:hypothetical protein
MKPFLDSIMMQIKEGLQNRGYVHIHDLSNEVSPSQKKEEFPF